jgi:hypothetical protein
MKTQNGPYNGPFFIVLVASYSSARIRRGALSVMSN